MSEMFWPVTVNPLAEGTLSCSISQDKARSWHAHNVNLGHDCYAACALLLHPK